MSLASTPSQLSQQVELGNDPLSAPHTPLMQSESLCGIESDAPSHLPTISETGPLSRTFKHLSSSSISLTYSCTDIQYSQQISLASSTLDLHIEEVSIVFEFLDVGAGSLSVQWAPELNVRYCAHQVVDILDIPCETEIGVSPNCSTMLNVFPESVWIEVCMYCAYMG